MKNRDDMNNRDDNAAAAEAEMLENALKNGTVKMEPDVESNLRAQLLSVRGQLQSAEERAKAERRMKSEGNQRK